MSYRDASITEVTVTRDHRHTSPAIPDCRFQQDKDVEPGGQKENVVIKREMRPRSTPCNSHCQQCPEQTVCPLPDLIEEAGEQIVPLVLFTHYRAGRYVYMQDEPMNGLYFVCTGAVTVRSSTHDGDEFGVHLVGTGGCLNITDALSKQHVYSASAKVLIDANIAFLRQEEFLRALTEQRAFALKLLGQVSRQMQRLEERQSYLACGSACERMLHLLRDLADLAVTQPLNGVALPATLERADLASLIATTPETISRLMSRLQKAGLVRSSMSAIHIPDLQRLKQATCCEP